ncbi:TIGR02569 family protein [Nonomuraea phyllanthi]|uniref:TIGR02569 family protein n=1 Tax=Nonomuraea phyllanthi TaxID=2219224 RepID=UPI001292EABB|nr:TIGR02569 family protein [Nonomuraea phyllanthi]QFY10545.1 TIGR02569 family protein [Nonomuraea phyllanthi]
MTGGGAPPPREVLAAFGASGTPVDLGGAWRAGSLAFKPVEFPPETLWRAEVLDALPGSSRFRIARPVRAQDGSWVARGWEACRFVAGAPDARRQDDVLRAGAAFHEAIGGPARPPYLDVRDGPWSHGDRVAWDERPVEGTPMALELLEPLALARRPVRAASQAVHGDLLGNVLFADGLPPAIIDWPVYWRPPAWAAAVAVVDALCWHGASPALAARWSHLPEWGQMLVRALIYRIVTDDVAAPGAWTPGRLAAYRRAIAVTDPYLEASDG